MAPAPGALEKEKGNEHFRAGRYVEAIGSYSVAIAADRKNPTYLLNRSQAYLKLYKFQDAIRDTSSCLALEPSNAKALFRRASAYKAMARFVEALNDLKKAQGLDSQNEQISQELDSVKELLTQQAQAEQKKKAQRAAVTKPPVHSNNSSAAPQTSSDNAKASTSTSALRSAVAQEGTSSEKPEMMEALTTRRFEKSAAPAEPPKPHPYPSQTEAVTEEKPSKALSFAEAKQARAQRLGQFKPAPSRPTSSSRSSSAETTTKPQAKKTEETQVQPLTTAFEFSRAWREAQQASPEASQQARLQVLQRIDPTELPTILGNSLEPEMLSDIVDCCHSAKDDAFGPAAARVLASLPKVQRFDFISLLMDEGDRVKAQEVLKTHSASQSDQQAWA